MTAAEALHSRCLSIDRGIRAESIQSGEIIAVPDTEDGTRDLHAETWRGLRGFRSMLVCAADAQWGSLIGIIA